MFKLNCQVPDDKIAAVLHGLHGMAKDIRILPYEVNEVPANAPGYTMPTLVSNPEFVKSLGNINKPVPKSSYRFDPVAPPKAKPNGAAKTKLTSLQKFTRALKTSAPVVGPFHARHAFAALKHAGLAQTSWGWFQKKLLKNRTIMKGKTRGYYVWR